MSNNTPTPAIPAGSATIRDLVIADARSLPDLIAKAEVDDPELAKQLTAKPLIASKSPAGVVVCALISWLATRYGLSCSVTSDPATCWTPDTINLVGGVATLVGAAVGAYIMRFITAGPIKGIFSKGATP